MFQRLLALLLRIATNTVITVASLAVALLLAEGFVRTYMPAPDYGGGKRPVLYSNLFAHDDNVGWKGLPGVRSPYFSKDFKVTISHDALGYRNIDPPFVPDKKNYLLLGDSYGWGWGVEDNETAAAVFNRQQSQANLYNLSIPGYGTDQEYLAMQSFLAAHPGNAYSGAILLFYYNDFENNALTESYRYPKPAFHLGADGTLSLQNVPVPDKHVPQDAVINIEPEQESRLLRSQLFNFFIYNAISLYQASRSTEEQGEHEQAVTLSAWEKNNQALTGAILADMKKYCAEHGMDFHVVFLITQNTDLHPATLIAGLAEQLEENHIPHSFFYSRKFPRTDLWLDTHYTPYGQALLADHISDVIASQSRPARP